MNFKKVFYLTICAVFMCISAVLVSCQGESSSEATTFTLRMGLISAEGHPVTQASLKFADMVSERTGGNVSLEVFPGGSLGGENDMQDLLSEGALDMASFGTAIPVSFSPEFQLLQMPFIWDTEEQMLAFADSEIQDAMNESYRQSAGIRVLASNWNQGLRNLISTRPVQNVEDFNGLKIRVPQVPAWVDVWEKLGCNVVILAWTELYSALQQGVCDAAEPPLYWMISGSLHEQAKNVTMTGHIMYYNQVLVNDNLFSSMPSEYQEILYTAAYEAGIYQNELVNELESDLRQQLVDAGVTFYDIDKNEIARITNSVYAEWESSYSADLLHQVMDFKQNN